MPLVAALLVVLATAARAQPEANTITGVWLTAAEDGYIQIFEENGAYFGKTVGEPPGSGDSDGPEKDVHNPDPAKRDRSLLGIRILKGFEYNGEGRWEDGEAYDPNNGKSYSAWIELAEPDKLKLRGYIGISLLGRTEIWTRAGRDAEGVHQNMLVETE